MARRQAQGQKLQAPPPGAVTGAGPRAEGVDLAAPDTTTTTDIAPAGGDAAEQLTGSYDDQGAGPRQERVHRQIDTASQPEAGARPASHKALDDQDLAESSRDAERALRDLTPVSRTDRHGRSWSFRQDIVNNQSVVILQVQREAEVQQSVIPTNLFYSQGPTDAIRDLDKLVK